MGRLLPFPERREPTPDEQRRTCFRCVHASFGEARTFCTEFGEAVDSELYAARACERYEEPASG